MTPAGILVWRSPHDAQSTAELVERAIAAQGLKLFARIAHDDAAAAVGQCMPFTKVFIFGNPVAGTPLILKQPTLALDLPLRIVVWVNDDEAADVWIGTNDPDWIGTQHGLLPEAAATFDAMKHLLARIADAVTGTPA